jgi:hypothetical protein
MFLKALGYSKVAMSTRALQLVLGVFFGLVGFCWNVGAYFGCSDESYCICNGTHNCRKQMGCSLYIAFYRQLQAKEETNGEKRTTPIL